MSTGQRKGKADRELDAIGIILGAMQSLDGESIQRVLDYVLGRLSIGRSVSASTSTPTVVSVTPQVRDAIHSTRQLSIRDLKEEKKPTDSNQMAALVAYYLSEMAPEGERKDAINSSDLEKYFKQAGFKLPSAIPQALPNAAAAGYFDATERGLYRLNPVGYNLVVHGLPRTQGQANQSRKRGKKKSGNKGGRR
jgi:hypothetical protein